MLVKILQARGGADHSFIPGDNVDLPKDVAKALIAAGEATEADEGAQAGDNVIKLKRAVAVAGTDNARLAARIAELEAQADELGGKNRDLEAAMKNAGPVDARVAELLSELTAEQNAHAETGATLTAEAEAHEKTKADLLSANGLLDEASKALAAAKAGSKNK